MEQRCHLGAAFASRMASGKLLDLSVHPSFFDHSVIFEIASKYCILDSSVDFEGYSVSSKGFLPSVVGYNGHMN